MFGRDPTLMRAAANALIACGGRMAAVQADGAVETLALPVCGLLSEDDPFAVAELFARLRQASLTVADGLPIPLVKLAIGASLACNPGPHVTDLGITDGMSGRIETMPTVDQAIPAGADV